MNDDLRRTLEAAGSAPVPAPDPAFADALEARLLAQAESLASSPGPAPAPVPPGRPRRPVIALRLAVMATGLAAAALVIAIGLGAFDPQTVPVEQAELDAPVNVAVVLPDGTILEDPDGLLLPAGAVITVGSGGSARLGDILLRPGDVVTVRDTGLEVVHGSPQGEVVMPTPARPRPTRSPASTPAHPSPPPSPGASASSRPSPTPDRTPGQTQDPGRTPDPTPAPSPRPTPTEPPATATPTPTPTPTPQVLRPRLRARLITGPRIAVRWTETYRAKSYVLLVTMSRSGPAADPVYPGSRVLGQFTTPPASALRFRVPGRVREVRLMVVALRANGTVLRKSRIVTITIPDITGSEPSPSAAGSPDPTPSETVSIEPSPAP